MNSNGDNSAIYVEQKKNIRYAEKRRTSTCLFSDRIAHASIERYRRSVPENERLPQTCVAAIVAYDNSVDGGKLTVMGLGVGTKFLPESVLQVETSSSSYGKRVRDCHAEVLARRAFRRQMTLEILQDLSKISQPQSNNYCILEKRCILDTSIRYRLRPSVSLHLYSSSAPCGNATLKKFARMSKERFREELGPTEWPHEPHDPMHGSSIHLGEFALLIKKDNDSIGPCLNAPAYKKFESGPQPAAWPAHISDDWTPPGMTTVSFPHKGSIHSCSDKICRWNYLGIQGSLLASLLEEPIYISTMTVGRKFSSHICRRAVCCRLADTQKKMKKKQRMGKFSSNESKTRLTAPLYSLNHPAVMGTAVYMDESGIVEAKSDILGQDVRFHSSQSWCWWPSITHEEDSEDSIECIDGSTGFIWKKLNMDIATSTEHQISNPPMVSTESLTKLFLKAHHLCGASTGQSASSSDSIGTLQNLRDLKRNISTGYELAKENLLTNHGIFRQWRRRYSLHDAASPLATTSANAKTFVEEANQS